VTAEMIVTLENVAREMVSIGVIIRKHRTGPAIISKLFLKYENRQTTKNTTPYLSTYSKQILP